MMHLSIRQRLFMITCSIVLGATLVGALASSVGVAPLKGRRSNAIDRSLSVVAQRRSSALAILESPSTSQIALSHRAIDASPVTTPVEAQPKLVVPNSEHDFGIQDPSSTGEHTFTIRNDGPGELHLLDHRSSCTCTVATFAQQSIPAGGTANIAVRWRTPATSERFEQTAEVVTDDPDAPSVRFVIRGQVRMQLGAVPQEFAFPTARPGQPSSTSVTFTSQVWPDFRIRNVTCSLEAITWTTREVPGTTDTSKIHALRAEELTLTLPPDLPEGPFQHWVRVEVDPHHNSLPSKTYEFPLRGRVLKRLAVYGSGVDHEGTLDLGIIPYDEGATRRWIVKVYDETTDLQLRQLEVSPDFVKARLLPYESASQHGLYSLELEIPPHSPEGSYYDRAAGTIHLEFNHPRIAELNLRLVFSIDRPLPQ